MTCSELIAELQRYPGNLPVRVLTTEFIYADENGEQVFELDELDAIEAQSVTYQGNHVLIESK